MPPYEHKRPESTYWGQEFFFNHSKKEHMPTRKENAPRRVQAPKEYMPTPKENAPPESTKRPESTCWGQEFF